MSNPNNDIRQMFDQIKNTILKGLPNIPEMILTQLSDRISLLIVNSENAIYLTHMENGKPVGDGVILYRDELIKLCSLLEVMRPFLEGMPVGIVVDVCKDCRHKAHGNAICFHQDGFFSCACSGSKPL